MSVYVCSYLYKSRNTGGEIRGRNFIPAETKYLIFNIKFISREIYKNNFRNLIPFHIE